MLPGRNEQREIDDGKTNSFQNTNHVCGDVHILALQKLFSRYLFFSTHSDLVATALASQSAKGFCWSFPSSVTQEESQSVRLF